MSRVLLKMQEIWVLLDYRLCRVYLRLLGVRNHGIFTYTKPAELSRLLKLSLSCPRGSRVLEVGSHLGASALFLASGMKQVDGKLYCVDTWQNETMPEGEQDTFAEFLRNTEVLKEYIIPLRGRSTEVEIEKVDGQIELLFIDGDHSYEGVSGDFRHFVPLLSKSGKVAFHDAISFKGVSKFTGELLATGEWKVCSIDWSLLVLERASFRK
jgi:predicted O-methyltransferase YrrM